MSACPWHKQFPGQADRKQTCNWTWKPAHKLPQCRWLDTRWEQIRQSAMEANVQLATHLRANHEQCLWNPAHLWICKFNKYNHNCKYSFFNFQPPHMIIGHYQTRTQCPLAQPLSCPGEPWRAWGALPHHQMNCLVALDPKNEIQLNHAPQPIVNPMNCWNRNHCLGQLHLPPPTQVLSLIAHC